MRDEMIKEKIKNAITILDEIDDMVKSQPTELQAIDLELSDYYHLIENNELNDRASIDVVKKIHELRKKRRSLQNEYEIERTYQNHKLKLNNTETRQLLIAEIYKTAKNLNQQYKNRILTDNDINSILNNKRKVGRPKKVKEVV